MTGQAHVAIGAASAWLLYYVPGFEPLAILPVISVMFAMLPDIEAKESKIKHFGYKGIKPLLPFGIIFHGMFKHRGFTHSLFLAVLVLLGGAWLWYADYIPFIYVLAALVGFLSHSVLDMLTPMGIMFLWPFKTTLRLLPKKMTFKTGGFVDVVLVLVGMMATLMYYLYHYQYFNL